METEKANNQHLLVIDDEVEITKSLFRQFRKKYSVHTATNGQDALKILEQEPVQVVLSDQRMPGMTGVDFFAKIKNKYPDALKLILTGYSDIEAVVGAINEGQVFRYLTKPWNPLELEVAVKEAFDKHELITRNKRLMKKLHEANIMLEKKVKERTRELEETNDRLKNMNIEKNKYIGVVAHDLRTPIGNAYSFSDLLITDYSILPDTQHIEFLNIIKERCSYSLNLIEEFLDASKNESGILDLNFKRWIYNDIVEKCISQNIMFAKKKSQEILFSPQIEDVELICDRNKIEQAINNLINNAIKFSPENRKIWIELEKEGNLIITKIVDEGPGIPENELGTVFNSYTTTSVKSTGGEKSTGLGLAIVKKIIESHNGELTVKSEPGKGSEFTFTIPVN